MNNQLETPESLIKDYIRVGTKYYMKQNYPSATLDYTSFRLVEWNPTSIKVDLESILLRKYPTWSLTKINQSVKEYFNQIEKYNGFVTQPNHIDYQESIKGFYNQYKPFEHPLQEGECPTSLAFMRHIFGNQYEMGLDYMNQLFLSPQKDLPILCLISKANGTGKTLFLEWLKYIYKGNMSIGFSDELERSFNSHWRSKLIIAIDNLNRRITARSYLRKESYKNRTEKKGLRNELFFAKVILCSNNESLFSYIDPSLQCWIRKIPAMPEIAEFKGDAFQQLQKEVPAFLNFLKNHKTSNQMNMFQAKLEHIGSENLANWLFERFKEFDQDVLYYTLSDLMELLPKSFRFSPTSLREILKEWGLQTQKLKRTTYISTITTVGKNGKLQHNFETRNRQARFYVFKKEGN